MSDRYTSMLVVFKKPMHEDAIKALSNTLRMMDNVSSVQLGVEDFTAEHTAFWKAKDKFANVFWDALAKVEP